MKAQVALNQFKATSARDPKRPLSYAERARAADPAARAGIGRGRRSICRAAAAPDQRPPQPPARRPGGGAKENFDLSTFYANEGALADSDNNLIPDRVDVAAERRRRRRGRRRRSRGAPRASSRPASRCRSRSTAKAITAPDERADPRADRHVASDRRSADQGQQVGARRRCSPAKGLIQLVKKAFGEKSALIVTGGDAAGVRARGRVSSPRRFPHIWQRGKDRTTLDDVEEDVRKFVAGRSPAGQAAMSLYKLDKLADAAEGQGSGVGAREGVRREGRRRPRRRREARRRPTRSRRRR